MVKWISAFWLTNNNKWWWWMWTVATWLGLRARSHLLLSVHSSNEPGNSYNSSGHHDNTKNMTLVLFLPCNAMLAPVLNFSRNARELSSLIIWQQEHSSHWNEWPNENAEFPTVPKGFPAFDKIDKLPSNKATGYGSEKSDNKGCVSWE